MSSMLGLLAEYGVWPHVINSSAVSNSVKVLIIYFSYIHDKWKQVDFKGYVVYFSIFNFLIVLLDVKNAIYSCAQPLILCELFFFAFS